MDAHRTPPPLAFRYEANGEAGTARLAKVLAPQLAPGDTLLLDGELAAGKTHFVKALVKALGCDDVVTSPTYALVHLYKAPRSLVVHVDAYRLNSPREYRDLGLVDYAEEAITVIEWGSKVEADHPSELRIDLRFVDDAPDKRVITLTLAGARWQRLVPVLSALTAGAS